MRTPAGGQFPNAGTTGGIWPSAALAQRVEVPRLLVGGVGDLAERAAEGRAREGALGRNGFRSSPSPVVPNILTKDHKSEWLLCIFARPSYYPDFCLTSDSVLDEPTRDRESKIAPFASQHHWDFVPQPYIGIEVEDMP